MFAKLLHSTRNYLRFEYGNDNTTKFVYSVNGDEIAELSTFDYYGLTPSTVSFHMKKLEEAGLVTARKNQYYTVYSLNRSMMNTQLTELALAGADDEEVQAAREEEYRQKVLSAFFEYGKLKQIPAQRKKKLICYEEIIKSFEFDRVYEEKELSEIIARFNDDYCTIRRDMISEGSLKRNGSKWERVKKFLLFPSDCVKLRRLLLL